MIRASERSGPAFSVVFLGMSFVFTPLDTLLQLTDKIGCCVCCVLCVVCCVCRVCWYVVVVVVVCCLYVFGVGTVGGVPAGVIAFMVVVVVVVLCISVYGCLCLPYGWLVPVSSFMFHPGPGSSNSLAIE